jgi:hypothetical protein
VTPQVTLVVIHRPRIHILRRQPPLHPRPQLQPATRRVEPHPPPLIGLHVSGMRLRTPTTREPRHRPHRPIRTAIPDPPRSLTRLLDPRHDDLHTTRSQIRPSQHHPRRARSRQSDPVIFHPAIRTSHRFLTSGRDVPPAAALARLTPPLKRPLLAPLYVKRVAVAGGRLAGGGPGSDLSEESAVGVGSAALDVRVAPECPPGLAAVARLVSWTSCL